MTEAAQQQASAGTTEQANAGASPPSGQAAAPPAASDGPVRPEGVPDSLWDAASGFKVGDAVKQLSELQAFKASYDSRAAAVPEKADAYELKLPPDFKAPDGVDFKLNPDDPMVAVGRQIAHAAKLDQAGFEQIVGIYAQAQIAQEKQFAEIIAREMQALGPKHADRVSAVNTFLTAALGAEDASFLAPVLQHKRGVEAIERLMRRATSGEAPGFSQGGRTSNPQALSAEEYERMTPAQKLVHARKASAAR